jgi:hypothetical protein
MKKKLTALSLLSFFLIGTLYLCPCKAAFAAETHKCCDKMKDCPSKDGSKGIKSLLSSFSLQESQNLNAVPDVFSQPVHYEINQDTVHTAQDFHAIPFDYPSSSPPDLFIKHAALLI